MAKKARQRISYVLELAGSQSGGHRLGVNGLAVDRDNAILYSGGRDGIVCAWDLNLDLATSAARSSAAASDSATNGVAVEPKPAPTKFRCQTQAHTHWINDVVLAQGCNALVSASSDLTVKVWRPHGGGSQEEPTTIGQHADYVKCVATPSLQADWVASGGLDRKIYLWDLQGGGETLEIDVSGDEVAEKGSVYALSVNHSILASGGPESILRLWDPKSGKRITKFVGHTDTVRSILVNQAGDTVMTASSDQTIKVWSVTAGRCMHTLTMHNDSVWSLFSDDPALEVFYSSDRAGVVVKTDTRGTQGELDDGLSLAVAQEHDGISKVVACGSHIWTATSSSSINRWADIETAGTGTRLPESLGRRRHARATSISTTISTATAAAPAKTAEIPAHAILRISNTALFPVAQSLLASDSNTISGSVMGRKTSEVLLDPTPMPIEPIHRLPEETIEGQFGLVKHRLLNDRRRVLTLDTAGDVLLWDLIKCVPIQRFGKKHLEDVEPEVNTVEAVAPWCSIDTSSGNLTVVLEPFNCFDAEMYADVLVTDEPVEFREDQRINLGKWILRYLFANLIDEELRRDEAHRAKLNEAVEKRITSTNANRPSSITIPQAGLSSWDQGETSSSVTPRVTGAPLFGAPTPSMGIGSATPAPQQLHLSTGDAGSPLDKRPSQVSRPSVEKDDYFSNAIVSVSDAQGKPTATPAEAPTPAADPKTPAGENGKDKDGKDKEKDKEKADNGKSPSTTAFGKKFRMGMSFGGKKLGRSVSTSAPEKPAVVDEKVEETSEASSNHEKEVDDSFFGVVQKTHNEYAKQLAESPDKLVETRLAPSLPAETPVLKLPPATKVIIQEETRGGSAELYRGTVGTVGLDADVVEQKAPMWLGDVLLLNTVPPKEPVKVSFVLHPWQDSLPHIATTDGNNRLNANRMLRVKKILAYVAERIEPPPTPPEKDAEAGENAGAGAGADGGTGAGAADTSPEAPPAVLAAEDGADLKPEEYLELYCNEQLLPINMTLATLRAHIWKGGNDVVLYYKANGRKFIPNPPRPPPPPPEEPPVVRVREKPDVDLGPARPTPGAAAAAIIASLH